MGRLNELLTTTKAKVITGIVAIAIVGGIAGGAVYYNHVQEAKAEAAAEQKKKDAAELKETKNAYDDFLAWKDRLILSEEENINITAKLEKLKGYIDSGKNTKEAPDLLAELDEQLSGIEEANKTLLADASKELLEADTSSYLEEDKTSYEGMKGTYQIAVAEGRYKDAYAYLDEMRAFTETALAKAEAAAEEAAKKAEAENNKKNSSSTSTAKNSNGGSNSGSGSSSSANTSGSASASSGNSSSEDRSYPSGYNSYEEYQESIAAKAQANAQGSPVPFGNGKVAPPDGWTVNQTLDWCKANGYL